jgi:hypothetical protein
MTSSCVACGTTGGATNPSAVLTEVTSQRRRVYGGVPWHTRTVNQVRLGVLRLPFGNQTTSACASDKPSDNGSRQQQTERDGLRH